MLNLQPYENPQYFVYLITASYHWHVQGFPDALVRESFLNRFSGDDL